MREPGRIRGISFFTPRGATMRSEVRVVTLVLAGWLTAIVGLQVVIYLLEVNYSELLLSEMTFFNLPIHFWLTGQFLPLWFIILCVLFNIWMDRHAGRNLDSTLRFRVRAGGEDE